jgi:hypothetical protein
MLTNCPVPHTTRTTAPVLSLKLWLEQMPDGLCAVAVGPLEVAAVALGLGFLSVTITPKFAPEVAAPAGAPAPKRASAAVAPAISARNMAQSQDAA